ncbi:hypothetical protein EV360DRAFT_82722 [Lentinula raphanica]|nr:hypothetical protein EV360DRAFT_82722 [Lentinula raphanica]
MSKPSLLRNLWRKIWNPTGFAGRDLEGNSYYERSNPLKNAGEAHPLDDVCPSLIFSGNPDDVWNYIGGSKRLPIQWSAWLAHTRLNPPSIQELQMDLMRQHRVQQNAALIEANFQQERAQLLSQDATSSETPLITSEVQSNADQDSLPFSAAKSTSPLSPSIPSKVSDSLSPSPKPNSVPNGDSNAEIQRPPKSLPKTGSDDWKPESWTPQLRVRRG